jgi:hypothetical protein
MLYLRFLFALQIKSLVLIILKVTFRVECLFVFLNPLLGYISNIGSAEYVLGVYSRCKDWSALSYDRFYSEDMFFLPIDKTDWWDSDMLTVFIVFWLVKY